MADGRLSIAAGQIQLPLAIRQSTKLRQLPVVELALQVQPLSCRAPLEARDGAILLHVHAEPLITAAEVVQAALVLVDAGQQLRELAIPGDAWRW